MKLIVLLLSMVLLISSTWYIWKYLDNFGSKIIVNPKTFGKGEYVTVAGKLKTDFYGNYTVGGYGFESNPRLYWSCVDKNKSRDEIINMADFVNSYRFYMRPPINETELAVLLDQKSKDNGWVQVTGELEKKKRLFTSTKAILIYGCPDK
jgi:hypothetical protein